MKAVMKRAATIAGAAAAASVFLFNPGAQAAQVEQDIIPCGVYENSGLMYWGNCTWNNTVIEKNAPGMAPQTECVYAKSAVIIGVVGSYYAVTDLHRAC